MWVIVLLLWSSLAWAQGPPNPWVRPNCWLGHHPAFTINDDFTTAGQDTAIWVTQSNTGSSDAAVTAVESAETLTLTPITSTGTHYNGYRTVNSYNLTDGGMQVEVVQSTSLVTGVNTVLSLAVDASNWYSMFTDGTTLNFNARLGSANTTSVTYSATAMRWWQIRHVSTDNTIRWETSPDGLPGSWTERRRFANTVAVTAMRGGVEVGTYQSVATPGQAIVDNLRLFAMLTGYRWYRSATPGIVPTGSGYILQQPAALTSARCPELGLALGQTRYLAVTVVDSGGTENLTPTNELQVIVSEGTIGVRP